jgi:hypothetical protein
VTDAAQRLNDRKGAARCAPERGQVPAPSGQYPLSDEREGIVMVDLYNVIRDLATIPYPPTPDGPEDEARDLDKTIDVLREHGINSHDFWTLDTCPGRWGYTINGREWHWRIRRLRNTVPPSVLYPLLQGGIERTTTRRLHQ